METLQSELAYELLPTTNEQILEIDQILSESEMID